MNELEKKLEKLSSEIKATVSPSYFEERGWWTPNQIRDSAIESLYSIMTSHIQELRRLTQEENDRRKNDSKYVKCIRCYGHHEQKENVDELCEKCEAQTAPFRFDEKYKLA